jgi:hypothetical protein
MTKTLTTKAATRAVREEVARRHLKGERSSIDEREAQVERAKAKLARRKRERAAWFRGRTCAVRLTPERQR